MKRTHLAFHLYCVINLCLFLCFLSVIVLHYFFDRYIVCNFIGRTPDHVFAEIYGEVNYLKISNLYKNKQNKKTIYKDRRLWLVGGAVFHFSRKYRKSFLPMDQWANGAFFINVFQMRTHFLDELMMDAITVKSHIKSSVMRDAQKYRSVTYIPCLWKSKTICITELNFKSCFRI